EMASLGGEFAAGTLKCVGITVAFGAGHGNGIGGDEFVKRATMAVGGDEAAFRLGDLKKVAAHARQADGLGWSRTAICNRHALHIKVIDDKEKGSTDENAD